MPGYYRNTPANTECMLEDGWMDTGDLGFIHEGKLVIAGRAKEVVIVRGANHYCYELEDR